jgi:hypothetical protein
MSRLLAATLLLSAVSIGYALNCVPIAPDAAALPWGQNIKK